MKTRIMIAQSKDALALTSRALQSYDLVIVSDVRAAHYQVMEDGIDLFLIGIHFDDSRAIDLVTFIRAEKKHKDTPIILVRMMPTAIRSSLRSITDALKKVGTISEYLELENDPEADKKMQEAVEAYLPIAKTLRHQKELKP